MKKIVIAAIFLIFFSCFSQAMVLQKEKYSPMETVIGEIKNIVSEIRPEDISIYDGRRIVLFERGLIRNDQTYYVYFIPTTEGNFSVKIDNLLYNSSGNIMRKSINKEVIVFETNQSEKFSVSPGVYEGEIPEVIITNLQDKTINISINKTNIEFAPLENRKVYLNSSYGFSMFPVGEYMIPIIKTGVNNKEPENESTINDSTEEKTSCINISVDPIYVVSLNETENYFIIISSNCFEDSVNLSIKTNQSGINFSESIFNLSRAKDKIIKFDLYGEKIGEDTKNISLYQNGEKIYDTKIKLYVFNNASELDAFVEDYNETEINDCTSTGGTICYYGCSDRSTESGYEVLCCPNGCYQDKSENKPNSSSNILIAILGIIVIVSVLFFLWRRSKKFKTKKPEEKFSEAEKRYEKKFVGIKKPDKK